MIEIPSGFDCGLLAVSVGFDILAEAGVEFDTFEHKLLVKFELSSVLSDLFFNCELETELLAHKALRALENVLKLDINGLNIEG